MNSNNIVLSLLESLGFTVELRASLAMALLIVIAAIPIALIMVWKRNRHAREVEIPKEKWNSWETWKDFIVTSFQKRQD